MTRNERAHAYLLAMLPEAAGNVEADILVKYAFSLADAFDAMASPVETPLPKIDPDPDADGWIPWDGGECPVMPDNAYRVKWRDGEISSVSLNIGSWLWNHDGGPADIVAYKVLS